MKQIISRCAAAALVVAAPLVAQRAPVGPATRSYVTVDTNVFALMNVRVIDGTGAAAREGQTIIVRDGRIAAVGGLEGRGVARMGVVAGADLALMAHGGIENREKRLAGDTGR